MWEVFVFSLSIFSDMIYTVSKAGDPMFELTNDQRKCFGLDAVQPHWQRIEAKAIWFIISIHLHILPPITFGGIFL